MGEGPPRVPVDVPGRGRLAPGGSRPCRPNGSPSSTAATRTRSARVASSTSTICCRQCTDAIERDPTFAAAQRWRFRHLFVDEYQDVNPLQERLLRAWLGDRDDLCVVGDPDQAIYRWNGADASFLAEFARHHPGAEVIELTDNYRSSPEILAVAASVLAGDRRRPRPLRAHLQAGPVPTVLGFDTDAGEAAGIARALRDEHGPRVPWSAQAVLVRTNAQTALIETALRKVGIPYRIRGGRALLEEPDVRDLLRGLARSNEPFVTTLADLRSGLDDDDLAPEGELPDPDSAQARRQAAFLSVVRLGEEFLILDRHALTSAFPAWLTAAVQSEEPDRGGDAVTLASFHAAKGLEWAVVHLAGMEDGFCPISHAREADALEEERRLLYVAVTRAQRSLRLTWARSRTFGEREMERTPSPYLRDVVGATESLGAVREAVPAPLDHLAGARSLLEDSRLSAHLGPLDLTSTRSTSDQPLLESLRAWRAEVARAARVAPSVVLADRTLAAVASRRPADQAELGDVPGIGPIKIEQYGSTLLDLVADHSAEDLSADHSAGDRRA